MRAKATALRKGLVDLVAVMADNEIFEEEALKNPFDYATTGSCSVFK